MEKLIAGIRKFECDVYTAQEGLFQKLVSGQHPQALFITCSDSRMVPDLICQTDPGDLFVLRNAGNLVPPYIPGSASAESATIEFAIRGLGVKHIIVCGHTRCGAMQAAMNPDSLTEMPRVRQWLFNADASAEIVAKHYQHLSPEARWKVMAQENVLVQLENLRTHPAVAVALRDNQIQLHAWMYKIETGQVFAYEATVGQYRPIVEGRDTSTRVAHKSDDELLLDRSRA